jgi:hypothetical protein
MALSGIDNPKSQIKKFADKLKDIVCLLLGCTREQLENHEFKNTELGDNWVKYRVVNKRHPIFNSKWFSTREELDECYEEWRLKHPDDIFIKEDLHLTPRLLMQLLGTDCGRDIIHPNIWVNALMSEYKPAIVENKHVPGNYTGRCLTCDEPFLGAKRSCTCKNCESRVEKYPNWIITDTRFPNELDAVVKRQGLTIKVIRPDVLTNSTTGKSFLIKVHKKEHESETALDKAEFDYVVYNTGTIEDLIREIKGILIQEKIIQYGRT